MFLGKHFLFCFPTIHVLHICNYFTSKAPIHVNICYNSPINRWFIWPNLWCYKLICVNSYVIRIVVLIISLHYVFPSLYKSLLMGWVATMWPLTLVNTHYPPLMLISPPTITNYLIEFYFFLSLRTYETIGIFLMLSLFNLMVTLLNQE